MMGMVSQAQITWDAGIIVASVIVGCVAATAAFLIIFHLQQIWQNDIRLQCIISLIMAIAVCGMVRGRCRAQPAHCDGGRRPRPLPDELLC